MLLSIPVHTSILIKRFATTVAAVYTRQGLHSVQNVLRHLVTAALTVHVVSRRRYFISVCAPNESQLHDLLPPKRDILVEVGFGVIILQSSQCWVGRWLQWIIAALTNTAGERGQ